MQFSEIYSYIHNVSCMYVPFKKIQQHGCQSICWKHKGFISIRMLVMALAQSVKPFTLYYDSEKSVWEDFTSRNMSIIFPVINPNLVSVSVSLKATDPRQFQLDSTSLPRNPWTRQHVTWLQPIKLDFVDACAPGEMLCSNRTWTTPGCLCWATLWHGCWRWGLPERR